MFNRSSAQKMAYTDINPQDAHEKILNNQTPVIDVREPYEYAYGHIKGSQLIPLDSLASKVNELGAKDQELIVVCASGSRSSYASTFLSNLGFTKILNLTGGMGYWQMFGLPVER